MPKPVAARPTTKKKASKNTKAASAPATLPSTSLSSRALEPSPSPASRLRMIEEAAYYIAQRDGFKPGREHEYWVEAERQIDGQLSETRRAAQNP